MDWELYDWWVEYLAEACLVAMTKDGAKEKASKSHFARVRAKSRFGCSRSMGWDDEGREKKKRSLSLITMDLETRDLAEMDTPLDTEPRKNRGGLVFETKGFNAPVAKPKTMPPTALVTTNRPTKSDRRTRGCAPGISKSSPFSRIEEEEVPSDL